MPCTYQTYIFNTIHTPQTHSTHTPQINIHNRPYIRDYTCYTHQTHTISYQRHTKPKYTLTCTHTNDETYRPQTDTTTEHHAQQTAHTQADL